MRAIEFETELVGGAALELPTSVAEQLPAGGHARVIVILADENDEDEADWRRGAYEQFMRDDDPADDEYEKLL